MLSDQANSALPIKVSILMITYNHEKFVAQAVESVLMQEVDFEYEIIIGEDCSTDHTLEIIRNIQIEHQDKIRLITSETNIGPNRNLVRTLHACRGKYIALLEGDDYWTATDKLRKQVDFLENHPDCTICFHNALLIDEDLGQPIRNYCDPEQKELSTLEDLLEKCFIPNCTAMFRNGLINKEFPDWFYKLPMGDWPLHVLNAQHGNIGYINDVMANYRIHQEGIWSRIGYSQRIQWSLRFYQAISSYLGYEYDYIIRREVTELWEKLAIELIERGYQIGLDQVNITSVSNIFSNWPDDIKYSKSWRKKVLGQIYERLFFAHYNSYQFAKVRYCLMILIRYKPSCLQNRGVWSIGIRSILNLGDVSKLRRED